HDLSAKFLQQAFAAAGPRQRQSTSLTPRNRECAVWPPFHKNQPFVSSLEARSASVHFYPAPDRTAAEKDADFLRQLSLEHLLDLKRSSGINLSVGIVLIRPHFPDLSPKNARRLLDLLVCRSRQCGGSPGWQA